MQGAVRRVRLLIQQLHQMITAQIGGHHNDRVAEINFAPFTVAHKTAVKHLIEQVQHITMGLLDFIQQHHAVRPFAHRFGQYAALSVTDIARGRPFQLGDGVSFLILR
ncbi:Protein of uncharacterised function (DUF3170) [Yersinia pseudotuberculosis]|nr:Protein of uncharacterised function (DUF3170) [Yersinia pseudotuberculosis]